MMVSKPEKWVKAMAEAGANIYTFHLEASDEPQQLIKEVINYSLTFLVLKMQSG